MIKKLKRKFILLATVSTILLMTVLVLGMNLINYSTVVREADETLQFLLKDSQPKGDSPRFDDKAGQGEERQENRPFGEVPKGMSPEVPYESRYFTVTVAEDGTVLSSDVSKIISVDDTTAAEYGSRAMNRQDTAGFVEMFRFVKSAEGTETTVIFLDCGRKLDAVVRFLYISAGIALLGVAVVFVVFLAAAERIVRPMAEAYDKQKRFITDAGHEMKTPLTIIRANVDLMEEEFGEQESLADIKQQAERLTALTGDLTVLSRMEEPDKTVPKIAFPVSDVVGETAEPFKALAFAQNKGLCLHIQPGLTMNGSPEAMRQLTSILMENALKYSPDGGGVELNLYARGKTLVLAVANTTAEPVLPRDLPHVFERFYRTDASRNSETGGHGIGLSIAKAITDAHGGKIVASTKEGMDFCVTATVPL